MPAPDPAHDDGELVCAAMAYATLALMQQVRTDAHLIVTHAPVFNSYFWPGGWKWEPETTARGNLIKARDLIDAQLAEPFGSELAPLTRGYPSQSEVAAWHGPTTSTLNERTLDLLRECGALRTALLSRKAGDRGSFDMWTVQIRNALGDVFLDLLDLADTAGFDLETATALRWNGITHSTPKKDVVPDAPPTT